MRVSTLSHEGGKGGPTACEERGKKSTTKRSLTTFVGSRKKKKDHIEDPSSYENSPICQRGEGE